MDSSGQESQAQNRQHSSSVSHSMAAPPPSKSLMSEFGEISSRLLGELNTEDQIEPQPQQASPRRGMRHSSIYCPRRSWYGLGNANPL